MWNLYELPRLGLDCNTVNTDKRPVKIAIGGAGYHASVVHPSTITRLLKISKAHEMIYVTAIPFPKLAILSLYFRLLSSRRSHYYLYLTGFIVFVSWLLCVVAIFANCRPFAYFWDTRLHGHCSTDARTVWRVYNIPNIVTDVMLIIAPVPVLWRLRVSMGTKIGVFLTFFIGTV